MLAVKCALDLRPRNLRLARCTMARGVVGLVAVGAAHLIYGEDEMQRR